MLTTSMVFKTELENLIDKAIKDQVEILTGNHTVNDLGAYKYHVGIVAGLRLAAELSDEAQTIINKRERGV